jgi:hypothetical protein
MEPNMQKKALTLKDTYKYAKKETFELNGEVFTFDISQDSAGIWAVWSSKTWFVYATINFEGKKGIPFDLNDQKEGCFYGSLTFKGELETFEEYKTLSKIYIRELIKQFGKGNPF